jgi:hypothetical protein
MPAITNDGNERLKYTSGDWFYMKHGIGEECDPGSTNDEQCNKNEDAVNNLRNSTNSLGASVTKYNDSKMLYNRELLFTVNILAGLVGICYYIYVNKSVIPSPSSAVKSVGMIGSSISGATKSLSSANRI